MRLANLFTISAHTLVSLWAGIVLCGECSIQAQNISVQHLWGKSIGKAQTDRDFLIYDATCFDNKLFIVGKAESGTGFELKQGENTYFQAKDDYTDAFLACMSLDGETLWSTYLPALEEGYYNAFSTTSMSTPDSSILVVVNVYAIQNNIEETKALIPACVGSISCFEFDLKGTLLYSNQFFPVNIAKSYFPPRLFKGIYQNDTKRFYFQGISIDSNPDYTFSSRIWFRREDNLLTVANTGFAQENYPNSYNASYFVSSRLTEGSTVGFYNSISLLYDKQTEQRIWKCTREPGGLQSTDSFFVEDIYCRGVDLIGIPPIQERWESLTQSNLNYYADPTVTRVYGNQSIFPGTVQNIHAYNGKFIVQGIHCRNYNNGFFKKDGEPYTYSHDTTHLIPKTGGFYQNRNNSHTAVPYLILYDSATLFGTNVSEEDSRVYDYQTPLWGSYLNMDWFYEDFFHVTARNQSKDVYQPYEPILCSSGDRVFLIGNAKSIGADLIDNLPMTEEVLHHQGVVLAFSISDCPPEATAFQNVRFLCPDDSVKLKLASDYAGFKFRFDPAFLADGSIALNADSTRAWAKKEGLFAATLDGSSLGCPDVTVDTVQIALSPYPEPVSALNPDSTMAACAAVGTVLQAVTAPDSTFSYRWFDGDTVSPKTVRFAYDSLFFAAVEVNGYCTSFRDSIQIRFLPPYVDLGKDSLHCTSLAFADTTVMLRLNARQHYFPDADWIFHWQINGRDASENDSLVLRYADLEETGINLKTAAITIAVSLSDAEADACTAHDTLVFSLASLPDVSGNFFLPQNESLCAHQDMELQLPDTADNYRCYWLDRDSVLLPYGYDTNRYTVVGMRGTDGYGANTDTRQPRFFQLKLDHKLCGVSFFDTLLVYDQVKPDFELPFHDTVICLNEPVELDSLTPFVYRPFYAFEWSDGTKGSAYSFADSGTYILYFFVNEDFAVCGYDTAADTVRVRWSDPALTLINIPSDTSFCEKLSVTLDASVPFPSTRYSWQEGNLDDLFSPLEDSSLFTPPIIKMDKEVSLALFVVDTMGCVNTKQIDVSEDDCKPSLSVPNVFTPNGDGVNDVLRFRQIDHCYDVDVLIVDRKGSRVLHQKLKNPEDFSWNGCMNNGSRKLPDGAYFYLISYKNAYGKKKYQSGSITILGSTE